MIWTIYIDILSSNLPVVSERMSGCVHCLCILVHIDQGREH